MKKYYIGIDPDLRLLNAAIITDDLRAKAVFIRRNKLTAGNIADIAVASAFRLACRLVEDVIAYFVAEGSGDYEIITVIESQNMMHTKKMREQGKNVRPQDILVTGQIAGTLGGAFSNMSNRIHLVQPMDWKKGVPKKDNIAHNRYYTHLQIVPDPAKKVKNIYPLYETRYRLWSADKINPGDYWDINDSLGLALYGAKKGL